MRILIITPCVGRNASGFVFEKLITELSKINKIDLITYDYSPENGLVDVNNSTVIKMNYLHPRIISFTISILNVNFLDIIWSRKCVKYIKKENRQYDVILSFIHSRQYAPLVAGVKLAELYKSKLAVYSIDAIPAPGWDKNPFYYKGIHRIMSKYMKHADALFSSNDKMLLHQLSTFKTNKKVIADVLYTPSVIENEIILPSKKDLINNFVYTGGIYGERKIKYLIEGFEKLLIEYPNSNLQFVGSSINLATLSVSNKETLEKIKIYPFTNDLIPYYQEATALIDIDAEINNDVFLSSKIINYVKTNRIIISETGVNSPSRLIFKGIKSIIQCNHNSQELYIAMKCAILNESNIKFTDRIDVVNLFSLEKVINRLNKNLNSLMFK